MEGLNFDNILGDQEIENLFMEPEEKAPQEEDAKEKTSKGEDNDPEESENDDNKKTTEDVDPDSLFGEEEKQPESVGSGKEDTGQGDSSTDDGGGASPENFYSSIASAMAEDGIFPNSDEESIKKVDSAESLHDLIEAEINAGLDEVQKRIAKALDNGVEPNSIRMYEETLRQLDDIKESNVVAENENGEQLRYRLIVQDYLNKGISREKADKMARRSLDAGTDIEDAKEALQSNKEYFRKEYDKLLKDAEKEADQERENRQKQAEKLKKSILEDKALMGDLEINNDMRKKAFDAISKPVYRDPETGEYLTSIQKYEMENRADFMKYVSLFYTMTNGFKDFDSFIKGKVKKETQKGLKSLEQTINGTKRTSGGRLNLVTTVKDDPESYSGFGFKLDL